jgi:hypothetical protein
MALHPTRRLAAAGFALALFVSACSSSSNPISGGGASNNGGGGAGGASLSAGLSANLDKLTSYQFSWKVFGSSAGTGATAAATGSFEITGTVINSPTKSMSINDFGVQYIQIGTQQWSSFDGSSWYASDATSSADLTSMLPTADYAGYFDTNATDFQSAGDETKNGVACVHYKGNSALSGMYAGLAGVSASFQSDIWIAKDGSYPVSGVYGFTATSNGQGGSFGYTFDITHVNDSANVIAPPTNVVAVPS